MNEPTIAQRINHRVYDQIHTCIRPGCGQRARVALFVEAPMRLGGRDFNAGDFVDLCPPDDLELRRAAGEAVRLGYDGPYLAVNVMLGAANPLDEFAEWWPPPATRQRP